MLLHQNRSKRYSQPEGFRGCDEVGQHVLVRWRRKFVKCVPAAGPSQAALNLVANEQRTVPRRDLACSPIEFFGDEPNSALTLNSLEHNSTNLIVEFSLKVSDVIKIHVVESGHKRLERIAILLLSGSGQGPDSPPMKRLRQRQKPEPSLARIVVRPGPREFQAAFD